MMNDAVVIEGFAGTVRTAAFLGPGGFGVQEGVLLVIAGWLSVPPAQALALVKRVPEILAGGVGLLAWLPLGMAKRSIAAGARRPASRRR